MFKHAWLVNTVCIIGIVGCMVAAPQDNTVTAAPAFRVMDDMTAYDNYIEDMCKAQANEVLTNLVMSEPNAVWTMSDLDGIWSYLYSNCIRDNGRST